MRMVRRGGLVMAVTMGIVASAWAADAQVTPKLKAKFSSKKITVKGKMKTSGDWPTTLRIALVDAADREIASGSDTLRGTEPFAIELKPERGKKFQREELMDARVRYSVMRERKTESTSMRLMEICPNLVKKKHWW